MDATGYFGEFGRGEAEAARADRLRQVVRLLMAAALVGLGTVAAVAAVDLVATLLPPPVRPLG